MSPRPPIPWPIRPRRHRGSAYLLVLGLTAIVVVVGLGSLAVARLNHRNAATRGDEAAAELLALSAIELALTVVEDAMDAAEVSASAWRPGFQHGVWSTPVAFAGGSLQWSLVDATGDEDLADSNSDPIIAYGRASVNDATRLTSVRLVPAGAGLEVLETPLHTATDLTNDGALVAAGGSVSVAGSVYNYDTISGDVDAGSVVVHGNITGTVTQPAPAKDMPPGTLYQTYADRATEIPWASFGGNDFEPGLLSASVNPYGPVNQDGVYRIVVPDFEQLKIRDGRIRGTLVIAIGYKAKVKFADAILFEPHRPDFPCLIVKGGEDAALEMGWPTGAMVDEASIGVNLNPGHTPYAEESDNSLDDQYTPEIRGLVHVIDSRTDTKIGDDFIDKDLTFSGTLVTEGAVNTGTKVNATLSVLPALAVNPPDGYSVGDRVAPLTGTWVWAVEP